MARILSHPFRLAGESVATVDQDDDEGHGEQLTVLLTTRRGERPLVPSFGVTDPLFVGLDAAEVRLGVALFGPPVTVYAVTARVATDTEQEVTVSYG